MQLRLAVSGSRSKLSYGTYAPVKFESINSTCYFDIANIEEYDVIPGTPFMSMPLLRFSKMMVTS
jgi:hypothetical protein